MKNQLNSLPKLTRFGAFCAAATVCLFAQNSVALSPGPFSATPPPLVGKYPVACSNVEQDFTRLTAGQSGADYWEGNPNASGNRYLTDLLVAPDKALTFSLNVPTTAQLDVFEKQGGKQLPYAAMACYPTTATNTRADYALPENVVIPRMERGADTALIAANPDAPDGKWPLIVLSHGLAGSPLGESYAKVIVRLAQEGYVVYAPFHADARFSRIKLNDFSDYLYVVSKYSEIAEMQAIRPLGLKQGLDNLLSRPEYAGKIDADRIAGFGASLGGMAMMLVQGAKMTTSLGGAERTIVRDNRYKAVVGYVPFSGYSFQPAFGDSNQGVKQVRVPYLGIGGTADVVAPISRTSQMIEALAGSKLFVTIQDMPHGLRPQDAPELFGWTFEFLKAHLSRTQVSRDVFDAIKDFTGNADDRVQIRKSLSWGSRDEAEAVEFVSTQGKYFFTARENEIKLLDSLPTLWQRTGSRFVVYRTDAPLGDPMCRFYANDGATINTHFHSTSPPDCALVRAQPWARDEGTVLRAAQFLPTIAIFPPPPPACATDATRIIRMFNSRIITHRYITEDELKLSLPSPDWAVEGAAFCAWRAPLLP